MSQLGVFIISFNIQHPKNVWRSECDIEAEHQIGHVIRRYLDALLAHALNIIRIQKQHLAQHTPPQRLAHLPRGHQHQHTEHGAHNHLEKADGVRIADVVQRRLIRLVQQANIIVKGGTNRESDHSPDHNGSVASSCAPALDCWV